MQWLGGSGSTVQPTCVLAIWYGSGRAHVGETHIHWFLTARKPHSHPTQLFSVIQLGSQPTHVLYFHSLDVTGSAYTQK